MATRSYIFVSGVETSTLPTATNPTAADDIIPLSYAQANFQINSVSGTRGAPNAVVAGTGIVGSATAILQTIFVQGSGGAVDISANPQLTAASTVGSERKIIGCSDTNTVLLEDGNGLELNGQCLLGDGDTISLIWTGSLWTETGRS